MQAGTAFGRGAATPAANLWPLVLLPSAWHYQHPLLFSLRHVENMLLWGLPLLGLLCWRRLPGLAWVMLLGIGLLLAWQAADYRLQREAVLAAGPEGVAEVAAGYLDGLAASGVRGTLKHFPGLGRVDRDTHLHPARLSEAPTELAADWLPFRTLAGHAGSALMLGHVTLEALDPLRAASHSPAVVQLLRGGWGYDGVLVTDDLNMGAVYNLGIGKVASEALIAGVDLVLVSYDPRQFYRALYCAAIALETGRLSSETLAASSKRLARFNGVDSAHPVRRKS